MKHPEKMKLGSVVRMRGEAFRGQPLGVITARVEANYEIDGHKPMYYLVAWSARTRLNTIHATQMSAGWHEQRLELVCES